MTPAARVAAAIELVAAIDHTPRKPADAVANAFFRERRYIGSGDRRAISERAWSVIRSRRRLTWWLQRTEARISPRMLVAASLMLEGWTGEGLIQTFAGGQYAPDKLSPSEKPILKALEGRTLNHPAMPTGVRIADADRVRPGGWPHRAAVAHAVYAPEVRHPVEVNVAQGSATEQRAQEEHLARWLGKRLDMPVQLYDLRPQGFELVGGRLLPDTAGPSAQLMYQNGGGQRVTLYLRKPEAGEQSVAAGSDVGQPGARIRLEARYALMAPDGDTVELHLADAGAPTLIRKDDKSPALYVLMPMRV